MGYSRFLAHYPYIVMSVVLLFSVVIFSILLSVGKLPEFNDPKLGFEPRRTLLSNRIRTFNQLLDQTQNDYMISSTNLTYSHSQGDTKKHVDVVTLPVAGVKKQKKSKHKKRKKPKDPFFCGPPMKDYSKIVFSATSSKSVFNEDNIRAMCQLEDEQIRSQRVFEKNCIHSTHSKNCCRSWSIGNYITLLSNKTACNKITADDLDMVSSILSRCSTYYHSGKLSADCESVRFCSDLPGECTRYNAVFNILHYLTDMTFTSSEVQESSDEESYPVLTYALTMLPMAKGISAEKLYNNLSMDLLRNDQVMVVAMDLGVKYELFDHYLIHDSIWFCLALTVITFVMWIYTQSLCLTLMTLFSIFLSLSIAYVLYTMVFKVDFFPFMNLLTAVILIGIGADDVFIYHKVWCLGKQERNIGTLERLIWDTIRHASLSMLVTSLTTASALLANFVSKITALKCFALYSSLAVFVHFILTLTWLPASVVVNEKWLATCFGCYSPYLRERKPKLTHAISHAPVMVMRSLTNCSRVVFEKIIPCLVIKLKCIWLLLFGMLTMFGVAVIFYHPKLQLPSSTEFQVFSSSHPFEVYDFVIKDRFYFEKAAGGGVAFMPLTFVWGVYATDEANSLDPFSEAPLIYDPSFNVSAPAAQIWLLQFCDNLRHSPFYQPTYWPHQLPNCFIEAFKNWMEVPCNEFSPMPCCKNSSFPFSHSVFHTCLKRFQPQLATSMQRLNYNSHAGLRFTNSQAVIVGLIVEFHSTEAFSFKYREMQLFYQGVNAWFEEQLKTSPPELSSGWFVSHLEFYDLQETIAQGTPLAIGVSLCIATVVAFLTTLNLLITLMAMITIAGSIFTTVGTLVLLGWHLNIMESVTISIAVGLSIDFSLHYGMAYRLAPDNMNRDVRMLHSLTRMGSAVGVAALTTFLAGLCMLPSTVLAYRQLGIFLMLVVATSWAFSTFFLQALLCTVGPERQFGQLKWPRSDCCERSTKEHVDKTIYTMSDSNYSVSDSQQANSSQSHELEPLNSTSGSNLDSAPRTSSVQSLNKLSCILSDESSSLETSELVNNSPDLRNNDGNTEANNNKDGENESSEEELLNSDSIDKPGRRRSLLIPKVIPQNADTTCDTMLWIKQ